MKALLVFGEAARSTKAKAVLLAGCPAKFDQVMLKLPVTLTIAEVVGHGPNLMKPIRAALNLPKMLLYGISHTQMCRSRHAVYQGWIRRR